VPKRKLVNCIKFNEIKDFSQHTLFLFLKIKYSVFKKYLLSVFLLILFLDPSLIQANNKEKAYSISLIKTAEIKKNIHKLDDTKVITETHTIKDGEHIWQILRKRGLSKKKDFPRLLAILKKLNKSFDNLDLVKPGQQIIIPLKITPLYARASKKRIHQQELERSKDLDDLNLENYTVEPGDSLIRVIKSKYPVPRKFLFNEYLKLVKKLNPSITELDNIYPRQIIRLPVYTPVIIRKPIKRKLMGLKATGLSIQEITLFNGLKTIFTEIGEEWVQTGKHFIPLKSGGQIDIESHSFPIINLRNGLRIIINFKDKLPGRMTSLIENSWKNYRIVTLMNDELGPALNHIFKVCNYARIIDKNETLEIRGDVNLKITGDWIIKPEEDKPAKKSDIIILNLIDIPANVTSPMIKKYLFRVGVKVIDYPFPGNKEGIWDVDKSLLLQGGGDPSSIIENILNLKNQVYSREEKIPVYESRKAGFKLIIHADFFLRIKGIDAIIDLSGLDPDFIALLEEHQFRILSLADEKKPLNIASKTLEFIGSRIVPVPTFWCSARKDNRNIQLSVPGIIFLDTDKTSVFATENRLPNEIKAFLTKQGYKILTLSSLYPG